MDQTRLTDERLKSWLNTYQPARERLCVGLLALDPRYSQIVPRLPEGGRDGQRDMQALLDKTTVVWGAVGFQNSVSDSDQERKQASDKFTDDLDGAIANKPDLTAFVFFTNVNLTPSQIDVLNTYAKNKGITHIDIYTRERMRGCLCNSGAGLALRYQFLEITMSDEEQKAFFESFGKGLEELVRSQGEYTSEGVKRLEFLHYMSRPLRTLKLNIHLKKFCNASEIGEARAICKMFNTPESHSEGWFIGGEVRRLSSNPEAMGTRSVYSIGDDKAPLKRVSDSGGVYQSQLPALYSGVQFALGAPITPEAFEGRLIQIYVSEQLIELVARADLILNRYVVASFKKPVFEKRILKAIWPGENEPAEWYGIEGYMLREIDFRGRTPPIDD